MTTPKKPGPIRRFFIKHQAARKAKELAKAIEVVSKYGLAVVVMKTMGNHDYIRYRDGSWRKLGTLSKAEQDTLSN